MADLPQRDHESLGCIGAVIPPVEGSQAAFYAVDVDAEIQASFNSDLIAVTLPKKLGAQKPEKKIQLQAAARLAA